MTSSNWPAIFLECKAMVWLSAALISAWATGLVWIIPLGLCGYGAIVYWNFQDRRRSQLTPEHQFARAELQGMLRRIRKEAELTPGAGSFVIEQLDRINPAMHLMRWMVRVQDLDRARQMATSQKLSRALESAIAELNSREKRLRAELESILACLVCLKQRSGEEAMQSCEELVDRLSRLSSLITS